MLTISDYGSKAAKGCKGRYLDKLSEVNRTSNYVHHCASFSTFSLAPKAHRELLVGVVGREATLSVPEKVE